jgi:lipoprotein-anchoring transpeptidase ErfK/SrfK
MFRQVFTTAAAVVALSVTAASAQEFTRESIEEATFAEGDGLPSGDQLTPIGFKLQALLDRAGVSPGILDGYYGMNVEVAVRTFADREGLEPERDLDIEVWEALGGDDEEVLRDYEITEDDVDGPFVEDIPGSFEAMAEMDRLAYTSAEELLAEKFHMSIEVLRQLNPDADFSQAGTEIVVAAVPEDRQMRADVGEESGQIGPEARDGDQEPVTRIEVDKENEQVRGYGSDGELLVAYPATIGSEQFPSPSGTTEVVVVVRDPNYTYTPESDVEGPDEALQLPPGPNGPVGSIWIDLEKEGYGIHGTSDPAHIRRQESHGCVRLTNWDAEELAVLVEEGATVEFVEGRSDDEDAS